MKRAIVDAMVAPIPFAICLYTKKNHLTIMFIEVAITEKERVQIVEYAQKEKIRMDRAYAELLRIGLMQKTGWSSSLSAE